MEAAKDFQVLATNLPPFFWRKVKKVIHKNQQGVLQQFLFGSQAASNLEMDLEIKIQSLQNQIDSLQGRVLKLEAKNPSKGQKEASEAIQINPNDDSPSVQKKAQKEPHFMALRKLSEDEQMSIILLGFRLNGEGKITLREYFEGTGKDTLFEWKSYHIKYDTIRRTELYSQLRLRLGI